MARSAKGLPGLSTVQGVPVGLAGPSPLSLPSAYLKSIGPPGVSDTQSVAQTGQMAQAAAKAPSPAKALPRTMRKIRVRKKRIRFTPGPPSGGFSLPPEPTY